MKVGPTNIFVLTILSSGLVLMFPFLYVVLNELFSSSLIMSIYFLQNKKRLDRSDIASAYLLVPFNICNLIGHLALIGYLEYLITFLSMVLISVIILMYVRWTN